MILVEPPLANTVKRERVSVDVQVRLVKFVSGQSGAHFWVGDYDNAISSAQVMRNPLRSHVFSLHSVGTKPEHQRQGIARQVVERVIAWVGENGGSIIFVDTRSRVARDFYASMGFRVYSRQGRDYYLRLDLTP